MQNIYRHIVPLVRGILAILLIFSVTESLRGACPHMGNMQREMEERQPSCCADSKDEGDARHEKSSGKTCCGNDGHFCACYPPLVVAPLAAADQNVSLRTPVPTSLLEEALYDASHEPVIPPPRS